MKKSFIFSLGLLVSVCVFECTPGAATVAEATKKGPWVIEPDSTLPNVLILGDSISIGYTLKVREHPTPFPLPIRVNLVRAPMHLDCGRAKLILRASYGRFFTLKLNT